MIGDIKNFDDNFFRMIGVGLIKTLTKCITWVNYFHDKKIRVVLPFYLSLGGNERFLLDAFVDDIVDIRTELNTDQLQRGVVTFTGFNTKVSEFGNPNQYLAKETVLNGEMKTFLQKTKGIPISMNYDVEITFKSEIEIFKASEKILNMLFNYMFYNIDYFGMKIDACFNLPDDKGIEIPRDINFDANSKKTIKFSLIVQTYYPSFFEDTDNYIICDNDDEIDWNKLCMKKPSDLDASELDTIRAVYWKSWIWDKRFENTPKPDGIDRENNTPPENF